MFFSAVHSGIQRASDILIIPDRLRPSGGVATEGARARRDS